jgi:hypothetical protein
LLRSILNSAAESRHPVIPEDAVALAHDRAGADAVPPAARRALDDLLPLELGEGTEHRERKFSGSRTKSWPPMTTCLPLLNGQGQEPRSSALSNSPC